MCSGAGEQIAQLCGVGEALCWRPQVDYITRNGWTPCLEFSEADQAYVKDNFTGAPSLSSGVCTATKADVCFRSGAPAPRACISCLKCYAEGVLVVKMLQALCPQWQKTQAGC